MRKLRNILAVIGLISVVLMLVRKSVGAILASGGTIRGMLFLALGNLLNAGKDMVIMAMNPKSILFVILGKLFSIRMAYDTVVRDFHNSMAVEQQHLTVARR